MEAPLVPLILASQSPRRRELLEQAGYNFEVVLPSETAECGICSRETPPEMVARLAFQKALDVVPQVKVEAVIVACDTVAECQGQILGKPKNRQHASDMLHLLSGRVHSVYSGLCVWHVPTDSRSIQVARSLLSMEALSEAEIENYLDSDLWVGKAGAFGFQDGHPWLKLIEGSPSNVVGLPMELLSQMLDKLGCGQLYKPA